MCGQGPPAAGREHALTRTLAPRLEQQTDHQRSVRTSVGKRSARRFSCPVIRPTDPRLDGTEAVAPRRAWLARGRGLPTDQGIPRGSHRKGRPPGSGSVHTTVLVVGPERPPKPRICPPARRLCSEPLALPGGPPGTCACPNAPPLRPAAGSPRVTLSPAPTAEHTQKAVNHKKRKSW